jgi:hypothetical protein
MNFFKLTVNLKFIYIIIIVSIIFSCNSNKVIIIINGKNTRNFKSVIKYKEINNGYVENYFSDTTFVQNDPYIPYSINGVILPKSIRKSQKSINDTILTIYIFDLKEKGEIENNKKTGIWTFYLNPLFNYNSRDYYYNIGYSSDSIVGPYFLKFKSDTLASARKLNSEFWITTFKQKTDTISNKLFYDNFLIYYNEIRVVNYLRINK